MLISWDCKKESHCGVYQSEGLRGQLDKTACAVDDSLFPQLSTQVPMNKMAMLVEMETTPGLNSMDFPLPKLTWITSLLSI